MEQLPPTLQFLGAEKKREQDTVLRMMCIDILLLLSTSKPTFLDPSKGGRAANGNFSFHGQRIITKPRSILRCAGATQSGDRSGGESPPDNVGNISNTSPQIKDAIERLVSLIQGEEGHDTKAEHIGELVKVKDDEAELDVVEV